MMGTSTTQEPFVTTMVHPPTRHHEPDPCEAQLADSVFGPILQSKEKGEKPSMEEIRCASRHICIG